MSKWGSMGRKGKVLAIKRRGNPEIQPELNLSINYENNLHEFHDNQHTRVNGGEVNVNGAAMLTRRRRRVTATSSSSTTRLGRMVAFVDYPFFFKAGPVSTVIIAVIVRHSLRSSSLRTNNDCVFFKGKNG